MRTLFSAVAFFSLAALAQDGRRGPPQEAITACSGLSANAACGFTFNGKNLTGTCESPPDGSTLACRPEGMHRGGHPHGPPPQEATAACANQSDGASCSFTHDSRTLEGTCRTPPGASAAACLPNHPHGPPPEATAACASSSTGASCTVSFHGRSLTGTCETGPHGGALACRPPRPD